MVLAVASPLLLPSTPAHVVVQPHRSPLPSPFSPFPFPSYPPASTQPSSISTTTMGLFSKKEATTNDGEHQEGGAHHHVDTRVYDRGENSRFQNSRACVSLVRCGWSCVPMLTDILVLVPRRYAHARRLVRSSFPFLLFPPPSHRRLPSPPVQNWRRKEGICRPRWTSTCCQQDLTRREARALRCLVVSRLARSLTISRLFVALFWCPRTVWGSSVSDVSRSSRQAPVWRRWVRRDAG